MSRQFANAREKVVPGHGDAGDEMPRLGARRYSTGRGPTMGSPGRHPSRKRVARGNRACRGRTGHYAGRWSIRKPSAPWARIVPWGCPWVVRVTGTRYVWSLPRVSHRQRSSQALLNPPPALWDESAAVPAQRPVCPKGQSPMYCVPADLLAWVRSTARNVTVWTDRGAGRRSAPLINLFSFIN